VRVAVVNLTFGGLSGGYRKYLQKILPLMARDTRVTALNVFLPAGNDDLILDIPTTTHWIPSFNTLRKVSWLKKEIAKWQPDVVFIPTERRFQCGNIPVVAMVRNMEPLIAPFRGNPLRECVVNLVRFALARHACSNADRIIAVSNYVKNYLLEKWNIEEHRVGLVYHGIDCDPHPSGNGESVFTSMDASPFLFTAGSIRPARGLEDIIRALAILNTTQPMQLIIGGDVDPGMESYFNELKSMANNSGISKQIHWHGSLHNSEMAWCFTHCKAFVMTSRVEACPNIALEAMSHGCVNIASANQPLPEFFADSAMYYPPKDFTALAKQIQAVISMGPAERATMSGAAKDTALRFSWEICAQKTVNELQKACRK
jgi:glycosyltransferase involved in cell wall biosynthesis